MLKVSSTHTRLTLKHLLLSAILFVCPVVSFAQNISIIYDQESPYQTSFLNALLTHLSTSKETQVNIISSADLSSGLFKNKIISTIVNLDSTLINEVIALDTQVPTFHAMTTLASARRYAPCLPYCLNSLPQHRFLILDQPADRQLRLIQLISPRFKNIGVIVTKYSAPHLQQLKNFSTQKKLSITDYQTDSANIRFKIDNISKASDIILAIADTDIYNSSSLPQMLLTSYRHRTPIIGFSKGFIKAGAIAGTVSSLQQLVQQLAERLLSTEPVAQLQDGNLIYPKYFDVISNRNVAKSLNIYFPSDKQLKQQLSTHESIQ